MLPIPYPPSTFPGLEAPLSGFRLRPAGESDAPFLRRLYRSLRADELALSGWSTEQKTDFCDGQFDLQHCDWVSRFPRAWFLIVSHRGHPVGRFYVDPPGDSFHVIDIGLLPKWRDQQLGSALIGTLQGTAKACGRAVTLSVLHTNPRAQTFYRRLGFKAEVAVSRHLPMRWVPDAQL
ncbi:MAG: GNAT family N-acetyltransferase [Rhodospirillales bacterium]|jgi:ribosomal protein S18 acetylase RimI-like enzyme|nr:GNAT family N-acetyltransferase [Rhodospirillales bacterium]